MARISTILYVALASVFCGNWALFRMLAVLLVEGPPLAGAITHPQRSTHSRVELLTATLSAAPAMVFLYLGVTNIVLMWIKLGKSSQRTAARKPQLTAFALYLQVGKLAFSFLALFLVILENWVDGMPQIHGYVITFGALLLSGAFLRGSKEVRTIIKDAKPPARRMSVEQTLSAYERIIRNVTKTTYPMVFGLLLMGLSSFAVSAIDGLSERGWIALFRESGGSSFIPLIFELLFIYSATMIAWTATMYLLRNAQNRFRYQANHAPIALGWFQSLRQSVRGAFSSHASLRKESERHYSKSSVKSIARPTTIVIHDI